MPGQLRDSLGMQAESSSLEWDYQPSDRSSAKSITLYRSVLGALIWPVVALHISVQL